MGRATVREDLVTLIGGAMDKPRNSAQPSAVWSTPDAKGGWSQGWGQQAPGGRGQGSATVSCFLFPSLDHLGDCSAPGAEPQCPSGPPAAEVAISCVLQVPPFQEGGGVWSVRPVASEQVF